MMNLNAGEWLRDQNYNFVIMEFMTYDAAVDKGTQNN